MMKPENEIEDANTETQLETTEDLKDLEPEKDVKGGGWPFGCATTTQASGPKG
jgi:hypothetical protein